LEETDGLIVPWAPQLHVLAHPSVCAFLTHCGWNSTLESISMGMPMIPIPFKSDQTTNCKLIVDIWKVGMNVRFALQSDEPVVDSDDLEKVVKRFVADREASELRARARQFKEKAIRAMQCGGTSYDHLQKLIRFLRDSPRRQ
jgi:anthocyanidin 3-O-glucoside 5-O-glucosyltransferase